MALAPAGGWAEGDASFRETLELFRTWQAQLGRSPRTRTRSWTTEGRRRATQAIVANFEHIPAELLAHQMLGAADCRGRRA